MTCRCGHVVAAKRKHHQRGVWHLHAQVVGHDLRAAVSADIAHRAGDGLCGRGSDQVVRVGAADLLTARIFVPYDIAHPVWMLCFLLLTAVTFSLFGFIIGLWPNNFQTLWVVPLMVVMPLTFLGGAFYSINMLPPVWWIFRTGWKLKA